MSTKTHDGPGGIERTVLAADRAGISYGRYVALYGIPGPERRRKAEKPRETRVCRCCGKEFSMEGRSHLSRYCSRECQYNAAKVRSLERYHEKRRNKEC